MSKYKLKCFNCGNPIVKKCEVWRTKIGTPVCEECFYDLEGGDFEDVEWYMDTCRQFYEKSSQKFWKYNKLLECPKCGEENVVPREYTILESCGACGWGIQVTEMESNDVKKNADRREFEKFLHYSIACGKRMVITNG